MTPRRPATSGAALLVILVFVAAITLVVVSLFAVTRQELTLSGAAATAVRADLAEEAAFAEAGALLRALTANDRYLVTLASRDSDTVGPSRYTFVSTPSAEGIVHTPLFAGGLEQRGDLPDLGAVPTAELAESARIAPSVAFAGPTRSDAILLPRLTGVGEGGSPIEENPRPALGFVEMPVSPGTPWRSRYTYWIEDLEGYPNLDLVNARHSSHPETALRLGYGPRDSRLSATGSLPLAGEDGTLYRFPASYRGQGLAGQIAPGLSPREIALQTWTIPGFPSERHPYRGAAQLALERHGIVGSRQRSIGDPLREPDRFVSGLHSYKTVPLVPYGHGYPDEGQPRFNLNVLVASRDIGIADLVARNLPEFENRKGGFPADEDYLATLAANAIDYADEDGRPSLPDNTANANGRAFRGVDAYCPVNEFFVKFEYLGYETDGTTDFVLFEATPYAEFWNPSNRSATMEGVRLRFRFLERFRFKANTVWHEIHDSMRELDEAFPATGGLAVTVPPNHYHVVRFGRIRWKVPVPRPPLVAFPVIQDLRGVANVSVRAHYELFLGDDLVDRCGRPDPADLASTPKHGFYFTRHQPVIVPGESFMRLAVPNLVAEDFGAIPKPVGSHLGDPWMPWYSRGTAEDAPYRLKASPGFRNYDHDKATPSQPDRFKDQTRVRDWPDRGYDSALGTAAPHSDAEAPDAFNPPPAPENEALAPWRLSNLGRFHSVTELGNLHDPVMWVPVPADPVIDFSVTRPTTHLFGTLRNTSLESLPPTAEPGKLWGGGNTLRIGRPEHPLFDRPGMRASQWLDLFHTGFAGTNLGPDGVAAADLYRHHDPRDHQPPPAAPDPVEAVIPPSSLLYDPDLNAQGRYVLVHGHLNLNTAPTRFEIETLLRGPSASCDIRLKADRHDTPEYEREGETGTLRSALREEAIPLVAEGLLKARPFLGPSHLARVLSEQIRRHRALPEHHNDAEAEETFARVFNATTLSSRHFRIHTAAEVYHATTGEVVGRSRRVRKVFLRPIRDPAGGIERVRLETISSREP